MSGPETVYAEMTSGSLGTVRGVETDLATAMDGVRDQVELIRYAEDKPNWSSPSARTRFNMSAWTTRATAEVSFIRLNRAKLAVGAAGDAYRWMDEAATTSIEHWRTWKKQVNDPVSLILLRGVVMFELMTTRTAYAQALAVARDFIDSDPLTDEQRDWLQNGLSRSMQRDLENGHLPGPIIPETLATGNDDGGWTPQGLGYDPQSGYLIQTSYHGDQAQLSLVDPDTGELVQTVQLGSADGGPPPDHAGGVAVHDGTVWVTSSTGHVYSYSLSDITSSSPQDTVPVLKDPQSVSASAYSTIVGDTMYVGSFEHGPGQLFTYTWDPVSDSWTDRQGPFPTPPETQGVAVRGGEIVFSTSWGRDNGSTLQSYNLGDVLAGGSLGEPIRSVPLPNMSEGIAMLPQGVLSTYESGAAGYVDPDGNPLEALWASMNMTVTPYDDLGLAGGIDVETPTLREASRMFDEVQDGLASIQRRIDGVTMPAGCLGDVATAPGFTAAIGRHCTTTATWLGKGTLACGVTASGLIASATGYDESDDSSGGLFDALQGLLP